MNFWLDPGTARHDRRGRFTTLTRLLTSSSTLAADADTDRHGASVEVATLSPVTRSSRTARPAARDR
jgi:hypothetical protein